MLSAIFDTTAVEGEAATAPAPVVGPDVGTDVATDVVAADVADVAWLVTAVAAIAICDARALLPAKSVANPAVVAMLRAAAAILALRAGLGRRVPGAPVRAVVVATALCAD